MRVRIITFRLTIPAANYLDHALRVAPEFRRWPGLLGKWWMCDEDTGTYGGVYVFASREDADRSRQSPAFRAMLGNADLTDVAVHEYDVLAAPTAITAPAL